MSGATYWHAFALAKLTNVMGDRAGRELAAAVLKEMGVETLASASQLRQFSTLLSTRGGFAAAVAALLALHATMYDSGHRPGVDPE